MNINLSLSPAPSITNKIAVVVYAADAPSVIVASYEFDPPHTDSRNITFPGLEPKTYIVNTYETTGLPTLGTLRHSFIYDASFLGAEIKTTEFLYMVGGASSYTDTNWIGWPVESIERVSLGTQFTESDEDETIEANISIREDGFDLVQSGDIFGDKEKWVVRFYPKINTIDPIFRSAKVVRGFQIIDSDITLTDTEAGLGLRLKGASSHFIITLPETSTIEDVLTYVFISDGGIHVGVTIQRTGTTDIFDLKGSRNYIELVQGDRLWISNNNENAVWVAIKEPASIYNRGIIVDMYDKPVNAYTSPYVFADGSLLDRTVYKGLFDYFTTLPSSAKIADALWVSTDSEKGKWTAGDGSTTFRVPRLYTYGFLRAVDGSTRLPGSFLAQSVGPHVHSADASDPLKKFVKIKEGSLFNITGLASGPGAEYLEQNTAANIGTETRPDNVGIYKLIYI